MSVFVHLAAGSVASVPVTVEAIGHGPSGWLVVLGYDHHLAPILGCVADALVLEVELEQGEARGEEDERVEWMEAA